MIIMMYISVIDNLACKYVSKDLCVKQAFLALVVVLRCILYIQTH